MTRVYIAQHPTDAHLLRGILEAEGIDAIVRGEGLFGARGRAPLTPDTLPSVWVLDPDDVERARLLVADYASGAPAYMGPRATWRCPTCRELIEAQFSECWNCGCPRNPW